jgi:RND superfamily putative drug exporter
MTNVLYRLGRNAARHPFRVLGIWVLLTVLVMSAQSSLGGELSDDFTIPGAESQQAYDLLQERFPSESHNSGDIVFHVDEGTLADPGHRAPLTQALADLGVASHVAGVSDPFDARGPTVSPDGRTAFATVTYDVDEITPEMFAETEKVAEAARDAGLDVEITTALTADDGGPEGSEMVGLLVAVLVLLVAFGSVIAMGIPIGTALFGILIGMAGVTVLAGSMDVPSVSPMLAMMIGLGVGIDYALFVVTRHRQNLEAGMSVEDAAGWANATAGQAVVFAGMTVVLAILGLQLSGLPAVTVMGYACAVVVMVSVLVAVTLLPAFLGLAGTKIDKLRVPGIREKSSNGTTASGRWARHVSHHPWRFMLASLAVLGILAVPVFGMRLGFADDSNLEPAATERKAYDLLADGFGAGFNGPLAIVVDGATPEALAAVATTLGNEPGIAWVQPPAVNEAGDVAVVTAFPTTSPQDEATEQLVTGVRSDLKEAMDGTGTEVYVGGNTAAVIDVSARIGERLPIFIGAVVLLSFLLLVVMFHSILVPLKAAVMNLLSIGAAYGVVVAVFQWGWGKGLVGIHDTMPINPFVPLIMFAILFGLSMDYEVFLLSRVREEYLKHGDGHQSVVDGLSSTARVITSAALIMISVFGAFVIGDDPVMKMFGLGLATAVLIDATIVRMVLVPATMSLLGSANWWVPGWLDRMLPVLDFEGGAPEVRPEPVVTDTDLVDDDERDDVREPVGV